LPSDVGKHICGWSGCAASAEVTLESRALCRNHFYEAAVMRLEEFRMRLQSASPVGKERIAFSQFLTELISQTTMLAATAKFLAPLQRDQFYELSLAAAELFKRVQRNPRVLRNMPILIYREADPPSQRELTSTVDVSKQGACVSTGRVWKDREELWVEKPTNQLRARARIAWLKANPPSQTLIGLEILDCEDFWGLGRAR